MESIADKQAQLAELQEIRARQNEIAMEEREKYANRNALEMKRWQDENAIHLREMEKNMKIMEEDMKVMERKQKALEKELTTELIKDRYLGAEEKINSIQVTDDNIEINGKKIKASDQKKYKELFKKYNSGTSEKELRKRLSDHLDGRKE